MNNDTPVQNTGREFDDEAVARAYLKRPPYPRALFDRLAELAPMPGHALDLGCGPGKLAITLADTFATVTAIDPAAPMIAQGRRLDGGRHGNIRWLCDRAETADLGANADLALAGASLHWMNHSVLFPRLAAALSPGAPVCAIEGDGPAAAPWLDAFRTFTRTWVERLGFTFDHPDFRACMVAHEARIDIAGRENFTAERRMPVADVVEAEHSRATWAKLGDAAPAFDAELTDLLSPHAEGGEVAFQVTTRLTWGWPRSAPKS